MKLVGMVHIDIGVALYALGILMLMSVAADAVLDRQAVWEAMHRRGIPDAETAATGAPAALVPGEGAIGCETCGLVSIVGRAHHRRSAESRCLPEVARP